MDYVDILNDLVAKPHSELTTLEIDVAVLNEFEIETAFGGGTHYFDTSCGDHLNALKDAASRHAFHDLVTWIDKVADVSLELTSRDRDTRSIALQNLAESDNQKLAQEGGRLAEAAHELCVKLITENLPQLESAHLARRQ